MDSTSDLCDVRVRVRVYTGTVEKQVTSVTSKSSYVLVKQQILVCTESTYLHLNFCLGSDN